MALSQAAAKAEQAVGHDDNAVTEQDVTNPARNRQKYGDPSGETMKALAWYGKGDVQMSKYTQQRHASIGGRLTYTRWVECPKPKVFEDKDVILKVTGSTICGSDLHLMHGPFP